MSERLTPIEAQFVEAYLHEANGDAAEAALLVGLPDKVGRDLMQIDHIRQAIGARLTASYTGEEPVTPTELHYFFGQVMRNPKENMKHRLRAAELIGRTYGLFRDVHEVKQDVKVQAVLETIRTEIRAVPTEQIEAARQRLIDVE